LWLKLFTADFSKGVSFWLNCCYSFVGLKQSVSAKWVSAKWVSVKPVQNLAFTALAFFRGIAYKIFLSYSVSFQKNLLKPISRLLPVILDSFIP
jgi:hypothetical protein